MLGFYSIELDLSIFILHYVALRILDPHFRFTSTKHITLLLMSIHEGGNNQLRGNFAQISTIVDRWICDFLWACASQVIQSYGSSLSSCGLLFLGAHFIWSFSLAFLFSGMVIDIGKIL